MKKIITWGIVFLFLFMSFTSISSNQINNQIIKTSDRIKTLYVGGSGPGNYTKIQDAIDDANIFDTIFVYNGTYYEQITISKDYLNLIVSRLLRAAVLILYLLCTADEISTHLDSSP